ncbi:MAG: hypothetical protein EHM87_08290 [Burkholderiales bacterium]|nr:MAG: hypothetical protein EHM87_08290 [Burkholderiales bacterium]
MSRRDPFSALESPLLSELSSGVSTRLTPEAVALSRTRARMAFRAHATVYAAVNAGLVAIWALSPAQRFWPGFVMAGWGVALALQAIGSQLFSPGSESWRRIHAEELARARRESA